MSAENGVDFRVVEHGGGADAHSCEGCERSDEPIVLIGTVDTQTYICARCMKGALGLLRGMGLTS